MNSKIAHPDSKPHFAERSPEETLFSYKWHRDRTKSLIRHVADLILETLTDATLFLVSSQDILER
jgi:hypothetical protein